MTRFSRIADWLRALWKWILSFRLDSWKLEDYPIVVRQQRPDPDSAYDNNPRFKSHRFVASIVNWDLSGSGDSREEALSELRTTFTARGVKLAKDARPLPRPGTRVPVEFASQQQVNAHPDLKEDFVRRVLGLDWAWISDESSLWDFHTEATNDAPLSKIREVYGVDVDDIKSAKICEILDRIAESRQSR
jgi:hypothetical protein